MAAINVILRRPPGPDSDFVEIETDAGRSIRVGEWRKRDDGYWVLRVTSDDLTALD